MSTLRNHIVSIYGRMGTRAWNTVYWAVDIHDTVVKANYKSDEIPTEFFPNAERVLQRLSKRKDTKLILYTCSYPKEVALYLEFFEKHSIHFDFVNKNPEAKDTAYGFYQDKPYYQIMLDDKAGFIADRHWNRIDQALDIIDKVDDHKPMEFTDWADTQPDLAGQDYGVWLDTAVKKYIHEHYLNKF